MDDCWLNWNRSASGQLVANATRFPHGIDGLARYVRALNGAFVHEYPFRCMLEDLSLACTKIWAQKPAPVMLARKSKTSIQTCAGSRAWALITLKWTAAITTRRNGIKAHACPALTLLFFFRVGYPMITTALNRTGRSIIYSCSWPDYLRMYSHEKVLKIVETIIVRAIT